MAFQISPLHLSVKASISLHCLLRAQKTTNHQKLISGRLELDVMNQNGILSYLRTTQQTHLSHLDMTGEQGSGIGIGYCFLDHLSFLLKNTIFTVLKMTRKWKIMKMVGLGQCDQTLCTSVQSTGRAWTKELV